MTGSSDGTADGTADDTADDTADLLYARSGRADTPSGLSAQLVLQQMPGYLIRRLDSRATALFEQHTQQHELTPRQFGLLQVLASSGTIKQSELSVAMGLDRSTLGEMLTRMIHRGLVRRSEATDDRRTSTLTLTPAGRSALHATIDGAVDAQVAFLAPLPDYLRPVFMHCLSILAAGEPESPGDELP